MYRRNRILGVSVKLALVQCIYDAQELQQTVGGIRRRAHRHLPTSDPARHNPHDGSPPRCAVPCPFPI